MDHAADWSWLYRHGRLSSAAEQRRTRRHLNGGDRDNRDLIDFRKMRGRLAAYSFGFLPHLAEIEFDFAACLLKGSMVCRLLTSGREQEDQAAEQKCHPADDHR